MFLPRTSVPASPDLHGGWLRTERGAKLLSFAVIGVICTAAFTVIYAGLRHVTGPMGANVGALTATIGVNFAANRRLTFRAHGGPLLTQAAGYGLVYVFGLGASSAALWAALDVFHHPTGTVELALALASSALATVVRYLMLDRWVFRGASHG